MSRKLFGIGAHGSIVGEIHRALAAAGSSPGRVDEFYGQSTATAVKQLQRSLGLPVTGDVDDDTWTQCMPRPIPSLFERALELTVAFEGHSYTLAVGDFDGAWLTWGIVGFTMKSGKVQEIISRCNQSHPELIMQAFGENGGKLLEVMEGPGKQQKAWASSVSINGRLSPPWRQQFQSFGGFPEVRALQRQLAHDEYFVTCLRTARRFNLQSELGIALCFDIHVQNGSINSAAGALIRSRLAGKPGPAERKLRETIANAVADSAKPAFREDVRSRKMAIATGRGYVHGADYDLSNWGLGEIPAGDMAFA
ncbi:MAG TPA: peptidoglycan-binding protein [Terriglobales bacterium]|nr:peptidoglycan-binding protein [Terriglobales bacterium]